MILLCGMRSIPLPLLFCANKQFFPERGGRKGDLLSRSVHESRDKGDSLGKFETQLSKIRAFSLSKAIKTPWEGQNHAAIMQQIFQKPDMYFCPILRQTPSKNRYSAVNLYHFFVF